MGNSSLTGDIRRHLTFVDTYYNRVGGNCDEHQADEEYRDYSQETAQATIACLIDE